MWLHEYLSWVMMVSSRRAVPVKPASPPTPWAMASNRAFSLKSRRAVARAKTIATPASHRERDHTSAANPKKAPV